MLVGAPRSDLWSFPSGSWAAGREKRKDEDRKNGNFRETINAILFPVFFRRRSSSF